MKFDILAFLAGIAIAITIINLFYISKYIYK